jgi:hypothetical protein
LEKTIILKDFLGKQYVANASPSQEDPYLSPYTDLKYIACSVQELWCSKVELTNPDAVVVHSSRTLLVYGSDIEKIM